MGSMVCLRKNVQGMAYVVCNTVERKTQFEKIFDYVRFISLKVVASGKSLKLLVFSTSSLNQSHIQIRFTCQIRS
jgi:hypothetical protein